MGTDPLSRGEKRRQRLVGAAVAVILLLAVFVSVKAGQGFLCSLSSCSPKASPTDFRPQIEAELVVGRRSVNFRFRSLAKGGRSFEWKDFAVEVPDGSRRPCTGDDSASVYEAGPEWEKFYVGCGTSGKPGRPIPPGTYQLRYRGVVVDTLTVSR